MLPDGIRKENIYPPVKDAILGVCGGRNFTDKEYLYDILDRYDEKHGISWIVSGGAKGADTFAEQYAKDRQVRGYSVFVAQWEKFGRPAGYVRNALIVEMADVLMAFPTLDSKGTWDTIRKAQSKGIPTYIFLVDNGEEV